MSRHLFESFQENEQMLPSRFTPASRANQSTGAHRRRRRKAKEDFRTKQIQELTKLQIVLDENSTLRSKYNALLVQIPPLEDTAAPPAPSQVQYLSDRVLSDEEVEALRTKLEQTLSEYRDETRSAGKLNSEIERLYTDLSSLKMKFRLEQDDKLTKQNEASDAGMANFKSKTQKVNDSYDLERTRLMKAIEFLKGVHDSSIADTKEFEEQSRSNNRGIQHLSASITIAKEDIRDFTDQLHRITPKLQEYYKLKEDHQKSEELVVKLTDEVDQLKKQVDTKSLTAKVRREIDSGNKNIADLNRIIDKTINKTAFTQDRIKETKNKIASMEKQIERMKIDTEELIAVSHSLKKQKDTVKLELEKVRKENQIAGGENSVIVQKLNDGIALDQKTNPWGIRKQVLEIKGEIDELRNIEVRQLEIENLLSNSLPSGTHVPPRKRVPMIPLNNKFD